jgi:hypothetical protein
MVLFVRAAERFFSGVPQPPPPWRPSPESAKAEDHMLRMRIASALRSQHQLNGWLLIVLGFVSAGHSVAAATYTTPRAMNISDVYEVRRDGWNNRPAHRPMRATCSLRPMRTTAPDGTFVFSTAQRGPCLADRYRLLVHRLRSARGGAERLRSSIRDSRSWPLRN